MEPSRPAERIVVGGKELGNDRPVYFIAEIGSNFDQDLARAKELIIMAKESGADAAKFQHYTADTLISDRGFKRLQSNKSHQASWKKSVLETYRDASLNPDWTEELHGACQEAGIDFLTSPYSLSLVDYVDKYVPAFKIGSGDITWTGIIEHIARKGKPIFLATGASSDMDVRRAVKEVLKYTSDIVLMQCNTNYTAQQDNYNHLNLNVIRTYQEMFPGIITGLSDHMSDYISVLGAVSLGARVVEKHFTDSVKREGPDHSFAMTAASFREMVDATRKLEMSLGSGIKKIESNEVDTVIIQRRSICVSRTKLKGDVLSFDDFSFLRPCQPNNIPPYDASSLIGRKLKRDFSVGEPLTWDDVL
jgi:sialic acid synthase SpsE